MLAFYNPPQIDRGVVMLNIYQPVAVSRLVLRVVIGVVVMPMHVHAKCLIGRNRSMRKQDGLAKHFNSIRSSHSPIHAKDTMRGFSSRGCLLPATACQRRYSKIPDATKSKAFTSFSIPCLFRHKYSKCIL